MGPSYYWRGRQSTVTYMISFHGNYLNVFIHLIVGIYILVVIQSSELYRYILWSLKTDTAYLE